MTASITLSSLCHAIELYSKSEITQVPISSWRSFAWLYSRFSFMEKLYGAIGLFRFKVVRERVLVTHILACALPYIERYQAGNWRRQDEERLHEVVTFVVHIIQNERQYENYFSSIIPSNLRLFLLKNKTLCSFSFEREKVLQSLYQMKRYEVTKNRARTTWNRYETFSEYVSRMDEFILEIESQADLEDEDANRRISTPLSTEKRRVESDITSLELRSLASSYAQKLRLLESSLTILANKATSIQEFIQKELKKSAIRFRLEPFSILQETLRLEENVVEFLVEVELSLHFITERMGHSYNSVELLKAAFSSIDSLEKKLSLFLDRKEQISFEVKSLQKRLETATKKIDEKLHAFFRMFDTQPLLPIGSILRTQQLKMMKMAREKLKQYRMLPIPAVAFQELEQHVYSIYSMVIAFYNEGIEIEKSRKQFKKLINDTILVINDEKNSSSDNSELQRILDNAIQIEQNLEIVVDRTELFRKVSEELIHYQKERFI